MEQKKKKELSFPVRVAAAAVLLAVIWIAAAFALGLSAGRGEETLRRVVFPGVPAMALLYVAQTLALALAVPGWGTLRTAAGRRAGYARVCVLLTVSLLVLSALYALLVLLARPLTGEGLSNYLPALLQLYGAVAFDWQAARPFGLAGLVFLVWCVFTRLRLGDSAHRPAPVARLNESRGLLLFLGGCACQLAVIAVCVFLARGVEMNALLLKDTQQGFFPMLLYAAVGSAVMTLLTAVAMGLPWVMWQRMRHGVSLLPCWNALCVIFCWMSVFPVGNALYTLGMTQWVRGVVPAESDSAFEGLRSAAGPCLVLFAAGVLLYVVIRRMGRGGSRPPAHTGDAAQPFSVQ